MKKHYYLIHIQFLGFRYSGWQKQIDVKTIQGMIDKTFLCILNHQNFKTLGSGRTDAKVSANQYAFELFVDEELDEKELLIELNKNLPSDISALEVKKIDKDFNIIQDSKTKTYSYFFSNSDKNHPFCAPFMVNFPQKLNINLMKRGAEIFKGEHSFHLYCYKPGTNTQFIRSIDSCEIIENKTYQANFFPAESWIFNVEGSGFMRHQIRLMMGALIRLGSEEVSLEDIKQSLLPDALNTPAYIVPSSGLHLSQILFK